MQSFPPQIPNNLYTCTHNVIAILYIILDKPAYLRRFNEVVNMHYYQKVVCTA
jgi:hypothetical protein